MQKKSYIVLMLVFTVLAAGYYYWNYFFVHSAVEALERANVTHGEILDTVKVDDGVVVYYLDSGENGIAAAYFQQQQLSGWHFIKGGGVAEVAEHQDISWCWSTLKVRNMPGEYRDEFLLGTMFGEVDNPLITSIMVKANIDTDMREIEEPIIEISAHIVECGDTRLWYVLSDQDISNYMKIYCYSAGEELLYIANDWDGKTKESSSGANLDYRISKSINGTFYAPDQKHFVELNAQPEIAVSGEIVFDVFLGETGGSKKKMGEQVWAYSWRDKEYVVWLNDRQFLLKGKKIINIDGTVTDLGWREITYASFYQVNSDHSKLALIGKDEECSRLVKIIDLDKLEVVAEAKHPYIDTGQTGELCNRLAWDGKDRVYYENDLESVRADGGYYIYCLNSNGSQLFSVNSLVLNSSPDFRYIVIRKVTGINQSETQIYDAQKENYLSGEITGQPVWVSPDKFVVVPYDDSLEDNSDVYLYKIEAGKIVQQKTLELPPGKLEFVILDQNQLVFTLSHWTTKGGTRLMEAFEVLREID
ncbi:MAG: hypothetical protein CVU90_08015 [Firmicutes bacterium HGW-Firmicutes-15]|nr:MAG: hypothetical protein CVU90_08015 [Firmicutes bacterium HGW-Firmicutes-15]